MLPTDLQAKASQYLPETSLALVERAHHFAAAAHNGQHRKSGEPYIVHPEQVALILTDLRLDHHAIAAALLHDVVEDCGVPKEQVAAEFGAEVAQLVDGVTKLSKVTSLATTDLRTVPRNAEDTTQSENLRKMLIAMAEDVRVVLIKLADRLHNMRTLQALRPERQRAIAQETMEIFAPLASRLGIYQLKWELEDLAFSYLEPERFQEVTTLINTRRSAAEKFLDGALVQMRHALADAGIEADVYGRPKHVYSVAQKLSRYSQRELGFSDIMDLLAVRVVVNTVPECYHALGVLHGLWHPVPGGFDDYIASPKESGYQSLHTTVHGPENRPIEVQIRTHEMHRVAEYGIAAHWRYKEGKSKPDIKFEERVAWLRQLLEWQKELRGAQEFVESVKADLFRDQVFVYTPRGEIKDLPAGASPIDFAYRVHTDLGNRCVGAKVNGRLVPLNTPLKNADVVEIIAAKTGRGPSRDWLNPLLGYVKTSHAREKIRQWFRRQERGDNLERGREILDKELKRLGIQKPLEDLAKLFKYDKLDDFFVAIGCGELSSTQIVSRIAQAEPKPLAPDTPKKTTGSNSGAIEVMGTGDLLTTLARCCNPVPGDAIRGFVTRTRGVSVHKAECPNIKNSDTARQVEVSWPTKRLALFPVSVRVDAYDRVKLLNDVTGVISEERLNLDSANTMVNADRTATIVMRFEISGLEQLSRVLAKLESVKGVYAVARTSA